MKSPEFNRLRKLVNDHILDFLPDIDQKSITLYESMRYSRCGVYSCSVSMSAAMCGTASSAAAVGVAPLRSAA